MKIKIFTVNLIMFWSIFICRMISNQYYWMTLFGYLTFDSDIDVVVVVAAAT